MEQDFPWTRRDERDRLILTHIADGTWCKDVRISNAARTILTEYYDAVYEAYKRGEDIKVVAQKFDQVVIGRNLVDSGFDANFLLRTYMYCKGDIRSTVIELVLKSKECV